MIYSFQYLLWIAPAVILGLLAQMWIQRAYGHASRIPARMSGYQAARTMLDAHGLQNVTIDQVPGVLSDHYNPSSKSLGLSSDVFHGRSLAAVGIATHEAGHALQDAANYLPLVVRNFSVHAARFGSSIGFTLILVGMFIAALQPLMLVGIVLFGAVVFFQLINLPVEFNASARAKTELVELGIVSPDEMGPVRSVLSAAALTYVAATLKSLLSLLYYLRAYNNRR